MEFPKHVCVTDQRVDLSALTDKQKDFFIELKNSLTHRYIETGKGRQVFFLAGPGGTGKSVAAAILQLLFTEENKFQFVACGIDAFHFTNEYLREKNLLAFKGRFDTYDTEGLLSTLKSFDSGNNLTLPHYSRKEHNPVVDGPVVDNGNTLWLLEGGWLLYEKEPWKSIQRYSNFSMFVNTDSETIQKNVTNRHINGGRSAKEAELFYQNSDALNASLIVKNRSTTDLVIPYYNDI